MPKGTVLFVITACYVSRQAKKNRPLWLYNCALGEMTVDAWERAANIYAELYAKRFTVKDADIVIAAFCMVNEYTLVTANTKDFENIDGMQFVNWTEKQ